MTSFSKKRIQILVSILKPNRLTRILDIGANPINDVPYKNLLKEGYCEIWGFEPQKDAYEQLIANAGENEHYFPYAIGDGKKHTLNICKSDGFTSILAPNSKTLNFLERWKRAMAVVEKEDIETKKLDGIERLPSPDLLKIDVQGAEKLIFQNGKDTLSATVAIVSEVAFVPLYEKQPLFHEQARLLEDLGFYLSKFMFLKQKSFGSELMRHLNWRKHQGQLIDGDAVFIKSSKFFDDLTHEQIKHLTICADSVFESFDLAVKCLSVLLSRGILEESQIMQYIKEVPNQRQG